jgi:hypothetical protein
VNDEQIHRSIEELVSEEHRLGEDQERGRHSETDAARLATVKITLDRYWDLLRQRRALSENGLDPDGAQVRDAAVVEEYRQ